MERNTEMLIMTLCTMATSEIVEASSTSIDLESVSEVETTVDGRSTFNDTMMQLNKTFQDCG